jgi:hypothetical protein
MEPKLKYILKLQCRPTPSPATRNAIDSQLVVSMKKHSDEWADRHTLPTVCSFIFILKTHRYIYIKGEAMKYVQMLNFNVSFFVG